MFIDSDKVTEKIGEALLIKAISEKYSKVGFPSPKFQISNNISEYIMEILQDNIAIMSYSNKDYNKCLLGLIDIFLYYDARNINKTALELLQEYRNTRN